MRPTHLLSFGRMLIRIFSPLFSAKPQRLPPHSSIRTLPLFCSVAHRPIGEFGSGAGAAITAGAGCATGAGDATGAGGATAATLATVAGGTGVATGAGAVLATAAGADGACAAGCGDVEVG